MPLLAAVTCSSVLCFVPELSLYSPSVQQIDQRQGMEQHYSVPFEHKIDAGKIEITGTTMPRYLTELEQRALDRALFRSVQVVDKGRVL